MAHGGEESDETLLMRIAIRDPSAFTLLVKRHTQRFYVAAYRIVLKKEDAEDVVQEAFCKLWNGKARWQEGKSAKFTTWFYRVVVNQALDFQTRKRAVRAALLEDVHASEDPGAEDILLASRLSEKIRKTLAELPERQRTAVSLFFGEELSQKETAEVMGVTQKAVESLIGRAKQFLRERININE